MELLGKLVDRQEQFSRLAQRLAFRMLRSVAAILADCWHPFIPDV
jgi:hypothetical protein